MAKTKTAQSTKVVKQDSFFHSRLQLLVAGALFPVGKGDWYKEKGYGAKTVNPGENAAFDDFLQQQKTDETALYYKAFKGLNFDLTMVDSKLTTGNDCQLEVLKCAPEVKTENKPGTGKHIVYFPGANTYYQACFRDITAAAKQTGATVHAFNFPGTGKSTGQVREANDLTNAGISVVKSLLKQGVHPDDIILQGDCYGAGIALEVKKQFEDQSNVKLRVVMNNAFKSFKAAVYDMITQSTWIPNALKAIVKTLLQFTGWHITPGKDYVQADPYQCHIQHSGDQTLISASLSGKVSKYHGEMVSGTTSSEKRPAKVDNCPEEYKQDRDALDSMHIVRVSEKAKERLGKKFGTDKFGNVNAHFADLCELELLNGKSVYEGYINEYLERSDRYIQNHPQECIPQEIKINYLAPAHALEITQEEADDMQEVADYLIKSQEFRAEVNFGEEGKLDQDSEIQVTLNN
ncbi:Dot/Icm T4SS effector alpha/beta hydrolase [Legionella quateirensis]|uniref:SdbB protein n=1 Tax=Legionella quateirensis TaxID=45072 RepID=A0A378KZQ5_9GAMM|nr:Dot/Icm T4SS effector alpha/beta hydrolase [Legionella quateirensis]KTD46214.1 SdbB protein (substrate of the Dot/Icm system) [Legionella quateirensis]STY19017.1 SdbB protein [Legionella quateirensis]